MVWAKVDRCKHGHLLRRPDGTLTSFAYRRPDGRGLQCLVCKGRNGFTPAGRHVRRVVRK
jgi:hypothetical protein